MRRVRLQAKILGYFGPLVAAVVLGAFWLVDVHTSNRVQAAAREQLETSRRVFEELLATRAEGLINAASLVAELGVFYQPLEMTDSTRLEFACQRINQLVGSEVVIVTDRMGVILARTDRRWEVGETFRETTAVARALHGERASTMWAQEGRLYAMVSVPVRLETGLAGTLSVGYRVDGNFALQLALLSGHDVAFLTGRRVVAASRQLEQREERAIERLAGQIQGDRAVYGPVDLASGLPAMVVSPFYGLQGAPIGSYAILRGLHGEAAELRALEQQTALIVACALGAALGIGFLVSRSIARPLTDLASAAHELGSGNYDFRLPPPAGSKEVEDLTRSFEAMRQSLKSRIDELRRLTSRLEQIVGERTAALESALAENRSLVETLREWNDVLERRVEERTRDLAEAQNLLTRQDRIAAIGRLAAGIAHEINNPLGILSGFAEGLLDRSRDPALARQPAFRDFPEYLKLIGQEVERLKSIVQRFLRFARSRSPEKQLIDMNGIARQVLELLGSHARREGKDLAGTLSPVASLVEADPEQLKQVVLNLALNGLDAVERGGWVRIVTEIRDGTVEVCVRDNGEGVPEALRGRVFEPFFSTKPPEKGTGLGLALCHDLVRENGGEIELKETAGGAGTEFVIRLPLARPGELRAHG
ncbi:MAG: HAMP domain-containing protein [Deltaproteobacteria bacterium]|nr:HAMP domain-containing protein [Deltaproteobacteria bacterium]